MNEIQNVLTKNFNENKIAKAIMPFAAILIYVYIAVAVINKFDKSDAEFLADMLVFISSAVYFAYLAGLVMCYAKGDYLALLIGFGFKAVDKVVEFFRLIADDDYMVANGGINGQWFGRYETLAQSGEMTFVIAINMLVSIAVFGLLTYWAYKQYAKTRVPATYRPMGAAPATKFCPSCGKPNPVEAPFCNNCGNKFMQ